MADWQGFYVQGLQGFDAAELALIVAEWVVLNEADQVLYSVEALPELGSRPALRIG